MLQGTGIPASVMRRRKASEAYIFLRSLSTGRDVVLKGEFSLNWPGEEGKVVDGVRGRQGCQDHTASRGREGKRCINCDDGGKVDTVPVEGVVERRPLGTK